MAKKKYEEKHNRDPTWYDLHNPDGDVVCTSPPECDYAEAMDFDELRGHPVLGNAGASQNDLTSETEPSSDIGILGGETNKQAEMEVAREENGEADRGSEVRQPLNALGHA